MKKRLVVGLVAGGLMMGLLPGVASAAGTEVANSGFCVKTGHLTSAADPSGDRSPYTLTVTGRLLDRKPDANAGFETGLACSADGTFTHRYWFGFE
jgi:hypothetical protein